jgi:hypothetical protein
LHCPVEHHLDDPFLPSTSHAYMYITVSSRARITISNPNTGNENASDHNHQHINTTTSKTATMTTQKENPSSSPVLTQSDIDHFLTHGYIKLSNCFTKPQSDSVTANVWTRLGMDPLDKSTWHTLRTNMPAHNTFSAADFAPKAWTAIGELLGGEDKISDRNREWGDGLIVNLGSAEGEGRETDPRELEEWHVDGDFFVHFLDSPEQGLLVIPLFTDIAPGGGGTMICPAAIPIMARYLRDHPEGVSPRMTPRALNPNFEPEVGLKFFNDVAKSMRREDFVEVTGEVGDVFLLHPLMLHAASSNSMRNVRIITNPPVSLKEPMRFDRSGDGSEYSLVEKKTLRELGVDRLEGWGVTGTRDEVVPERLRRMARMKEEEVRRMEELEKEKKGRVEVMEVSIEA